MATNSRESSLIMRPERRAPRYPFAATAEATDSSDVRPGSVQTHWARSEILRAASSTDRGSIITTLLCINSPGSRKQRLWNFASRPSTLSTTRNSTVLAQLMAIATMPPLDKS